MIQVALRRTPNTTRLLTVIAAALVLALAIIGPALTPEPSQQDLSRILRSPDTTGLLGTDHLGRDQLSRISTGARNSLVTVLVVLAVSGIGAGVLGLFSGYISGRFDLLLQRLVDAVMAMPLLVLALAVAAASGNSFWAVSFAIAVAFAPLSLRVARAAGIEQSGSGYVAAARISGASTIRIVLRHLAPNALGPWAVVVASQAAVAVLVEAALAFLGVLPGRLTLGGLLGGDVQIYMYSAPWLVIWPGVALALMALAINLAGDWIADSVTGRASAPV